MSASAGALPIFPHCRSSARSSRSFSPRPLPSQLPNPPPLPSTTHNGPFPLPFPTAPRHHRNPPPPAVFFTAAVVPAPAGTFSIFPHCPSSDCSRRSTICFSHYRSSVRSRRSSLHFFPLPQQCLLPQELSLCFPTAPAVSAPAGALPVFPHCRSSDCSPRSATCISPLPQQGLLPQERYLYFPLPQQCPLPQEPSQYFPIAAAVPAPAGAPLISPHCRSSVCSRRSAIYISPLLQQCPLPQEPFRTSPLPQQCLLPQELHQYLPTAAAVSTLTSSFLSPRCHSSTLQQKPLLPPRCRSIITSGVQHPISPKPWIFWGVS